MIDEKQLYKVVKQCLPNGYDLKPQFGHAKVTDNTVNTGLNSKVQIIPNTIAIYFKNAERPYRLASGSYVMNSRRVIFNLYTDRANDNTVAEGYEILSKVKANMLALRNSRVNIGTVQLPEYIRIVDCEIAIDNNYIGMTEQGQAIFSLELKLIY